ncbi:hypothetical protein E4633_15125 [Geomonas terrae]|uniref:Uncharacterized protein n=1 Tax=Geomonas terrae TaxID=2562681 RepID=A0A4S1CDY1_9BACT|nr:hypothetical protein [Geomonas terrae]TGU71637.1 hypothetical protein E4633_15125 [Geomonas terrae]
MDFKILNDKFLRAINQVLEMDSHLLVHDINEPCISHRLAMYLANEFPDFDVDCEYNGDVDAEKGRKYIKLLRSTAEVLGLVEDAGQAGEVVNRCIYPDIVVHKRGKNGPHNNLLVIEVKKTSNPITGDWDAEKLRRFTSGEYENHFEYMYGAFVKFTVGGDIGFELNWFSGGERWEGK